MVVERKEDCICLEMGVQQTNNIRQTLYIGQTTGFWCIPFLCILRNIPVSILECINSAGMIRHQNDENSRPSCQSSFLWNPLDSAGTTGFLQELGGHCKDLNDLQKIIHIPNTFSRHRYAVASFGEVDGRRLQSSGKGMLNPLLDIHAHSPLAGLVRTRDLTPKSVLMIPHQQKGEKFTLTQETSSASVLNISTQA